MVKKIVIVISVILVLGGLVFLWNKSRNRDHLTDVIDFSKQGDAEILKDGPTQYSVRTRRCTDDFLAAAPNAWCTNVITSSSVNLAPFVGKKVTFDGYYFTKPGDKTALLHISKVKPAQ